MKKKEIIIGVILCILIIIGIVFLVIDTNNQPINEIPQTSSGNEIKSEKTIDISELPLNYTVEQAIKDKCFVISGTKAYNVETLERFIENTKQDAENRKEDSIKIVRTTMEGDPIITQIDYKKDNESEGHYILKVDSRRDKYAAEKDRTIKINEDIPGSIYTIIITEKENIKYVKLSYGLLDFISEEAEKEFKEKYKNIDICSYGATVEVSVSDLPSFFGKVIETDTNHIIVEPNEGEMIRRSADKISIGLGEYNDAIYEVGTNVKITYTGDVRETYPAQIDVIKIEIKSVDDFELRFYDKHPQTDEIIYPIISKDETDLYDYNIYAYGGQVNVLIDGKEISLKEALLQQKITMNEIISKANHDFPDGVSYDDGGSMEYHYDNYTIIKVHKLDGNRDVYIGIKNLKLQDLNV